MKLTRIVSLMTLICISLPFQVLSTENQPTDKLSTWASSKSQNDEDSAKLLITGNSDDKINEQGTIKPKSEKELFAIEVLRLLHEEYARPSRDFHEEDHVQKKSDNRLPSFSSRQSSLSQLLSALGADGDIRRLVDWAQNSFNLASIGEIATQFVVSKLGSVNCAALFSPDKDETLLPRFLLFNEHFSDVPFELPINPSTKECIENGKFDPARKTIVLIHGYLAGYTIVDGLTNIKNRFLDLNNIVNSKAMHLFEMAHESNGSYVLTDDLDLGIRKYKFNVIIVDWFNGANPVPRANYIKSAVNAQVVGQLIARFLSALVTKCKTPAARIQLIAHSLGCHVAGFTGKAMNNVGHRLGKITHLDPIGLCFGHLFSDSRLRLSPDDAIETQAIHVSLNLFDNPLDGAKANFLVNGGRDQIGCGGQSELKNSTTSSLSLLFDSEAGFTPCSHVRALSLYEDDLSSQTDECQIVGYRCQNYERFLAGKCGHCDPLNNQCRLMSLPPVDVGFNRMSLLSKSANDGQQKLIVEAALSLVKDMNLDGIDRQSQKMSARSDDDQVDRFESLPERIGKLGINAKSALADGWSSIKGLDMRQRKLNELSEKFRTRISKSIATNETKLEYSNEIPLIPIIATSTTTTTSPSTSTTEDSVSSSPERPSSRFQGDIQDVDLVPMPLGGQKPPAGSLLGPIYYLGTGPISPYCVNYYQFRVLIAESRVQRLIETNNLNSLRRLTIAQKGSLSRSQTSKPPNAKSLHLTVKLVDSNGRFFKGFTLKESLKDLKRVQGHVGIGQQVGATNSLIELTMLLNSTRSQPIKVSETIVSYYFHNIVIADRIEVNYMSNISPEIRAKYSSTLCPVAINDRHQLVSYIECGKISQDK